MKGLLIRKEGEKYMQLSKDLSDKNIKYPALEGKED